MPTVIAVRLRNTPIQLWFDPQDSGAAFGDHVVVSTERGVEMGLACSDAFEVEESELRAPLKPVLRIADEADLARAEELGAKAAEAMPVFRELAREQGLDMKPVDVEFLFDGDKAVFYFAAEERIDFRGLVRELAARFRTRIDMRQIGVRDEARLVGGIAHCGQELCCVRMGGEFKPVSIRMAKEQDLPLNPAKISGVCGRLMCCLRYEFEAYKDFKTRAPKKNALIETPLGMAKVIGFDTPLETIQLRMEDGATFSVPLKEMGYEDGTFAGDYDDRAPVQHDAGKDGKKGKKGDSAKKDGEPETQEQAQDAEQAAEEVPAACAACATASGKPACPGRPCLITRESLEAHGGTQIGLALTAWDREHGLIDDELLEDDLLEPRKERKPRRRNRDEADEKLAAEEKPARSRRKRGGQGKAAADEGKKDAAAEEAKPEGRRRRRRRGGSGEGLTVETKQGSVEAKPAKGEQVGGGRSRRRRNRGGGEGSAKREGQEQAARRDGDKPRPGQNSSGLRTNQPAEAKGDGAQGVKPEGHRRRRRRRHGGAGQGGADKGGSGE